MLSLTDQIGVGNTQFRQHRSLETFHGLGLIIAYVVVSEKMQNTVHRQMLQMVRERLALTAGKANWGAPFRFGLVQVEDADMAVIAAAMGCGMPTGA